ncbi:MAG TPA: SDR family oxidoreductase [Pseudonocardiaceae bacterium]|nr:SDR family oxidoreductase [Pseudonocardiaceae bacterium]
MDFTNTVAVITGANRGLGRSLAAELIERGAKVYAGARDPRTVDLPGAIPLRLDITDPTSVQRASELATDVNLFISNAGIDTRTRLIDGPFENIRQELETHLFGTLTTLRAFAPAIERNGGGTILNILSVLSWVHPSFHGAYSVGKSAAWAMTDVLREELAPKGIKVAALHVGYMNTDMAQGVPPEAPKTDPLDVARAALDGLAEGSNEIIVDEFSKQIKQSLAAAK